jgi:amino acid adenylation domain-containing protein
MIHVHDIVSDMARQHASRAAIRRSSGSIGYASLEARANGIAQFLLRAVGDEPGANDRVFIAILSRDPAAVIACILGVLKAGCVFVPIEWSLPSRRVAALVAEVRPALVLCDVAARGALGEVAALDGRRLRVAFLDGDPALDSSEGLESIPGLPECRSAERISVRRDGNGAAYVYFTSGSTGRPKAILGRLCAIEHFVRWEIDTFRVRAGTRVSQLTTVAFDAFLRDMFTPLCAGGSVCLPSEAGLASDPAALASWIDEQQIELLHCVPSVFRALLNAGLQNEQLASLRTIAMAGEALLPADVKRWMAIFGDRVQLVNLYGPSETTMTKFVHLVGAQDAEGRSVPIGKPMPGARAMVVDAAGEPVPDGSIGEIYIRTPYCSLGYYRQAELTSAAFFANPFGDDPSDLIYKTGDYGRVLESGDFELLGRRDHQVKIRGVRVELGEIESVLREHELVRDVAVVDHDDRRGNKLLCAHLVLSDPTRIEEVRAFVAARLPSVLVPAAFVSLSALPRTITRKVDRKALRPPPELAPESSGFVAPRSPREALIAEIWRRALNVAQVGVRDNFFALGGHSLLAIKVLARVFDAFQVEVPLRTLLTAPTVAGLAEAVEVLQQQARGTTVPALVARPRTQSLPLSSAQRRLWMLDQIYPGGASSNMHAAARIDGPLHVDVLTRSLQTLLSRHEALRTRFVVTAGEPQQLATTLDVVLEREDMRGVGPSQLGERLAAEAARPFDLERAPLCRFLLVDVGAGAHVLLVVVHHIVADAESLAIFFRELWAVYAAVVAGKAPELEPLALQHGDFCAWARECAGAANATAVTYWRETLAHAPELLPLPLERPRPALPSGRGAQLSLAIPEALALEIRRLAQSQHATVFMVLLTAFEILLHRYSGETDILVGTPVSNRGRTELDGVFGLFVDILVLRNDLSGDPSSTALIERVRDATLRAYDHRFTPLEQLVTLAGHRRDPSYHPLFQVMFGFGEAALGEVQVAGLRIEPLAVEGRFAKFDLFLAVHDTAKELRGTLEYASDLFSEVAMRQVLASYETLLRAMVATPEVAIDALPILSDVDRRAALDVARQPARATPAELRRGVLQRWAQQQKAGS